MTRVFPDPAAASTSSGPSVQVTASFWGGVRSANSASASRREELGLAGVAPGCLSPPGSRRLMKAGVSGIGQAYSAAPGPLPQHVPEIAARVARFGPGDLLGRAARDDRAAAFPALGAEV